MIAATMIVASMFNLACSGTTTTVELAGTTAIPYAREYRVDLVRNSWCADNCREATPIKSVSATKIVFVKSAIDTLSERRVEQDAVDRETGEQTAFVLTGRGVHQAMVKSIGRCERQPFTGFPKRATKF